MKHRDLAVLAERWSGQDTAILPFTRERTSRYEDYSDLRSCGFGCQEMGLGDVHDRHLNGGLGVRFDLRFEEDEGGDSVCAARFYDEYEVATGNVVERLLDVRVVI